MNIFPAERIVSIDSGSRQHRFRSLAPSSSVIYFSSVLIYTGWEAIQTVELFYERDISLITFMELWLYSKRMSLSQNTGRTSRVNNRVKKRNKAPAERDPDPRPLWILTRNSKAYVNPNRRQKSVSPVISSNKLFLISSSCYVSGRFVLTYVPGAFTNNLNNGGDNIDYGPFYWTVFCGYALFLCTWHLNTCKRLVLEMPAHVVISTVVYYSTLNLPSTYFDTYLTNSMVQFFHCPDKFLCCRFLFTFFVVDRAQNTWILVYSSY